MADTSDGLTRPKLGRPPKPQDELRSERVVSFVTRGEFDTLCELANDRGESISATIHLILSSALAEEK
jgi:hypothetical protein